MVVGVRFRGVNEEHVKNVEVSVVSMCRGISQHCGAGVSRSIAARGCLAALRCRCRHGALGLGAQGMELGAFGMELSGARGAF